jgi:serine/threonine protein kinase
MASSPYLNVLMVQLFTADATSKRGRTTVAAQGTPAYRAPELLREKATFANKVDIWNLGTVIYELIALRPLFDSDFRVQEYDRNPDKMASIFGWAEFPGGVFEKSSQFILSSLLTVDYENRRPANACVNLLESFIVQGGVAFINDLLQSGAPTPSPGGAGEFIRVWKWLPRYLDWASDFVVFSPTGRYYPFVSYVEPISVPKWDHLDRLAFSLRVDGLTFGLPFKSSAKFWKG